MISSCAHGHESPLVVWLKEVLAECTGHGYTTRIIRDEMGDEWAEEHVLMESSLRFARPASRTSTETVGSSVKRVATTRPAVCVCEPAQ